MKSVLHEHNKSSDGAPWLSTLIKQYSDSNSVHFKNFYMVKMNTVDVVQSISLKFAEDPPHTKFGYHRNGLDYDEKCRVLVNVEKLKPKT